MASHCCPQIPMIWTRWLPRRTAKYMSLHAWQCWCNHRNALVINRWCRRFLPLHHSSWVASHPTSFCKAEPSAALPNPGMVAGAASSASFFNQCLLAGLLLLGLPCLRHHDFKAFADLTCSEFLVDHCKIWYGHVLLLGDRYALSSA